MKAQAMILAAGRGQRMRPLTDAMPKPLLPVQGQPLMQWHMQALARGGFTRLVVNTAWLGEQIEARFGAHAPWPAGGASDIAYSHEGRDFGDALETAGGIVRALPRLDEVFWAVAGDVHAPDFRFSAPVVESFAASGLLAQLWLVVNPPHHPQGDFGIDADGRALDLPADAPGPRFTFSGIGLYRAELFGTPWCEIAPGNPEGIHAPLAPLLRRAMGAGRVGAQLHTGRWTDVGTPERLAQLNAEAA